MDPLLELETDQVLIRLTPLRSTSAHASTRSHDERHGHLKLTARRPGLQVLRVNRRCDASPDVYVPLDHAEGLRLYEETDYRLEVQAKARQRVTVHHADPLVRNGLEQVLDGSLVFGLLNFGSQVGYSTFHISTDDRPELDLEVEVFPSKLDYRDDYDQMLAEVQSVLVGLALDYLKATLVGASFDRQIHGSSLEWTALLRHVIGGLEQALRYLDRHPVRGLIREALPQRVDRLARVDSRVRASLRKGVGGAACVQCGNLAVREVCIQYRPRPTLDTPEHRWLARQLRRTLMRLADIRRVEEARPRTARVQDVVAQLEELEARVDGLCRLEAMVETGGDPPAAFTSQVLTSAPGYREAYHACLLLSLGLRIEGEPLRVSLKDLSVLYEYWCFLSIVRMVAEETGAAPEVLSNLFTVARDGLRVQLQRGRDATVQFGLEGGRKLSVAYNPSFSGRDYLIPQKPDVVITLDEPSWPQQHLVLDAKYRLDDSDRYVATYGVPGAPEDALNAMHRYRDAITVESRGSRSRRAHAVVQAAALFPGTVNDEAEFRASRLWRSLERIGVGAMPFLPHDDRFVREWLRSFLGRGGWALADIAVPHRSVESIRRAQGLAAQVILIGVLRPQATEHMSWIRDNAMYYMPLLKTPVLQYAVDALALYVPARERSKGRIDLSAPVVDIELRARGDIATPWQAARDANEPQVVFRLGEFTQRARPITNERGERVSGHRWTTMLAFERAASLEELMLETEAEWRLYEDLTATGTEFALRSGDAAVPGPKRTRARVWFVIAEVADIAYRGPSGFQVRYADQHEVYLPRLDDVLAAIQATTAPRIGQQQ